jgi:hypothetical protein
MANHRNAVSVFCRVQNVGSTCNAGGSSSLHTRMNAEARLMQTTRCAATHLKRSHRLLQHASNTGRGEDASSGTASAAHSTARAPLQPHLHFLQATPRHTLHHHLSPPRHAGHAHIGRRSGQSMARERHTGGHERTRPHAIEAAHHL